MTSITKSWTTPVSILARISSSCKNVYHDEGGA